MNAVAGRMKSEPGLYAKVMRYVRGEENALDLKQIKDLRRAIKQIYQLADARLEKSEQVVATKKS